MHDARFFQSSRGKIVTALRRRHSASAVDLAREFGLSPNAVRQQLLFLERDGYVAERSVKRGRTKPTLEYSLTPQAESLFPQHYDKMLNAVLEGVKETLGHEALASVFASLGERAAAKYGARMVASDPAGRVLELAELLRERGVEAEVVTAADGTLELREHNCPYAKSVAEHPEMCGIIHHVLRETVSPEVVQIESIATGGDACRFEVKAPGAPLHERIA